MTKMMNAYGFVDPQFEKEIPAFEVQSVERPIPKNREILVEVKAVSINPTDLATRQAKKEEDHSFMILGRDAAGVVVEVGSDVELFKEGDEVYYPGTPRVEGTQADYHLIDERMVALKPNNLNFAEAAALPLTALTAYEAFFDRLDLLDIEKSPEDINLLIVGAAGGVGSIASQIALAYGFNVIGTASKEESTSYLRKVGVNHIINHYQSFEEQLKETGIDKVDAVFLAVKPDENIQEAANVIKAQGRMCSLLPLSEPLPNRLFTKSVIFSFELMYTRSLYQTEDWIKQHKYLTDLTEKVEKGAIQSTKTVHYKKMTPETLKEAYEKLNSETTVGKIVLEHQD